MPSWVLHKGAQMHVKNDCTGTLVIEFEISVQRAFKMKAESDTQFALPAGPYPEADPIQIRVVVERDATVDFFYRDVDVVGLPCWQSLGLSDVFWFTRIPDLPLSKRLIVAEAFSRLAAEGSRRVTEAPTGARVVDLGLA